jgi:hypothetical protein
MAKIDVEKLRAALIEAGMEEEQIEEVIAASSDETEVVSEGNDEESSTSGEVPPEEEAPSESEVIPEGEDEVVPPQDEVPAESESVPPVPPEAQEEVPPTEVPPEEPSVPGPEVPPQFVSIEEFETVKNELAEQKKANEGLLNRLSSLEEALKKAGVIDGSEDSSVGVDDPQAPGSTNVDTTMDDVLREINTKRY